MKLVSGKCLWKPRKLRRLRFFTKTIQLPWLWATGRAYINRFICLILGTRSPCQCWVWPCGRVVPSSTDIVQSDIVSPMKWDMTTYHLLSPLPRGHTTPHTAQPGTLWEIQINSENVMVILILLSHSYPLTLTLIKGWSKTVHVQCLELPQVSLVTPHLGFRVGGREHISFIVFSKNIRCLLTYLHPQRAQVIVSIMRMLSCHNNSPWVRNFFSNIRPAESPVTTCHVFRLSATV